MALDRSASAARLNREETRNNTEKKQAAHEAVRARFHKEYYSDYSLIFVLIFMLAFGLVMLFSTSSYQAGIDFDGDSTYYFRHQLVAVLLGVAAMFGVSLVPYRLYRSKVPMYLAYAVSVVSVFIVLTPLGYTANGARRWFRIGPVSVQPAEIAKLGMIIFLAAYINKVGKYAADRKFFWIILIIPLPVCAVVYGFTDNLSSAIIILGIALLMLFIAIPDYKRFLLILGVLALIAGLAVLVAWMTRDNPINYRFRRILIWLDPEAYASDRGFQTIQALYAIGSGGIFGKGLGQSMQKRFIPEAQNDMIFSIICEELGLFGAIAVIVMFVLIIWRLMIIATNALDRFGALLVVGVMGHLAIQVILNIAVVTNVMPNTGITLPFISYGGSAVVLQMVEIGICLSVARSIRVE
ncbi:MAG: cell division protein FtsW [Lachnospiraceae bacterium]|nr:cell division protein FtsW [Lachnospiraceae bacterium]